MHTTDIGPLLAGLFSELVDGAVADGGAFVLNSGDVGLLRSLDTISPTDASRSVNGGATIARMRSTCGRAVTDECRASEGGILRRREWDEAWKTSAVDGATWDESDGASRPGASLVEFCNRHAR